MALTLQVDIVSTQKSLYSGTAEMVIAPGEMGELGILPRHSQLLTRLKPGQLRIKKPDGEEELIYISGGFLEVQPYQVTVLADTAERAKDLDEAAALAAKQRAEQMLANRQSEFDYSKARAELAEAAAQIQAISRLRKIKK